MLNAKMKDETLIKGDVNELKCMTAFEERGYSVSIPFDGSSKYDFIADIEGKLLRIQCKASRFYKDDETSIIFDCSCSTTNTKKTVRHLYSKSQIDYFMTTFNQYSFLVPVEETSTQKILRIKEPKNNQIETINVAADYLLDNVLSAIVNGVPIKRFIDTYIKSIDKNGMERIWSYDELKANFNERQIRYIKEAMRMDKQAYEKIWIREEFPNL